MTVYSELDVAIPSGRKLSDRIKEMEKAKEEADGPTEDRG